MRNHAWVIGMLMASTGAACAPESPLPRPSAAKVDLLRCGGGAGAPKTKVFRAGYQDTLELNGHMLVIPAGALTKDTEFRMRELPMDLIKVRVWGGKHWWGAWREDFKFQPEHPATLFISYRRCETEPQPPSADNLFVYRLRSNDSQDNDPLYRIPRPPGSAPTQFEVPGLLNGASGYGVGRTVDGGP